MSRVDVTGRCLCGAVTLHANVDEKVGACHCDLCRGWGGGPLFALDGGSQLQIEGEEHVACYASSERAERGFCARCGSHLFIRVRGSGRLVLPAGLFPLDAELRFDHQIFIDKKPGFYTFADETKCITGDELFAQAAQGRTAGNLET
jgi:hypothetical protein